MPDRDAIKECPLQELIDNLPLGYVTIGDSAYTASEHLAAIFFGQAGKVFENDNFNYYASQCRIRIEMAFGMMSRKWGILQKPLQIRVTRIKYVLMSIARLHNYCINERMTRLGPLLRTSSSVGDTAEEPTTLYHMPTTPQTNDNTPLDDEAVSENFYSPFESLVGQSMTRHRMVLKISEMGLTRPTSSVLHNRRLANSTSV
jgi:DDE superfamily endonuclease